MSAALPLLSVTGLAFLGALRQSQTKPNSTGASHHSPEASTQRSSDKPNHKALHEAR